MYVLLFSSFEYCLGVELFFLKALIFQYDVFTRFTKRLFPGGSGRAKLRSEFILVNLILVNFGGFLVIARNPPDGF